MINTVAQVSKGETRETFLWKADFVFHSLFGEKALKGSSVETGSEENVRLDLVRCYRHEDHLGVCCYELGVRED